MQRAHGRLLEDETGRLVYSFWIFIYVFTKIYGIRDCLYKEST
ncbi:hypothetical protein PCL1606_58610 [Pseudomonas chlororaphis]|uniref:Uncharacterized protein n=1 Tax=Pseudomonas chlororaphis TaxID=587753 RepID=A0A0D5Y8K2_9PSED|nr:hypothetical protein PCL1606_58610 [Pseudomonas chlororaphis]